MCSISTCETTIWSIGISSICLVNWIFTGRYTRLCFRNIWYLTIPYVYETKLNMPKCSVLVVNWKHSPLEQHSISVCCHLFHVPGVLCCISRSSCDQSQLHFQEPAFYFHGVLLPPSLPSTDPSCFSSVRVCSCGWTELSIWSRLNFGMCIISLSPRSSI